MKKTYLIEHPVVKLSLIIFHSLMFRFHLKHFFFKTLNVFLVMHADHNDHHDDSYYPGACSSQCLLWCLCITGISCEVYKELAKTSSFYGYSCECIIKCALFFIELCINTLLLFMF